MSQSSSLDWYTVLIPGLVYRLDEPSVVALLFGSGKAVITGAKTTDDVTEATNATEARLTDLGLFE